MKHVLLPTIVCLLMACSLELHAQAHFSTSLHATREGKAHWYEQGFYLLTNVDIADLGCKSCHGPTDADGNAYTGEYQPGCVDCHPTGDFSRDALSEQQCLGCHGRQVTEINKLGLADVHRSEGLKCWDCHKAQELHGNGNSYVSMLEAGAMTADCGDCHKTLPQEHNNYDPHSGALHCNACHSSTVISCYNCHFESQVVSHVKRAKQPISDFVLLVNRSSDNKVGTASFQSLTWQGKAFVAFAPYHAHAIEEDGRTCADCHVNLGGSNEAIEQYNQSGTIQFATWDSADSTLNWMSGVVPMPADYQQSFKMDFITYNGNTADPVTAGKNWSLVGREWTAQHMLFATPLTEQQMTRLGMNVTAVEKLGDAKEFHLEQNYPNPFNPSTTITYSIGSTAAVEISVRDAAGMHVRTLVSHRQEAGRYAVKFDADGLASGVYFLHLQAGAVSHTRKMLLLR